MKTLKKKSPENGQPRAITEYANLNFYFVTDAHLKAAAQHYHAKIIIQF